METAPAARAADRPASFAAVGAGSCAASGCHGGPREQGIKGSEYSTWAAFDKHARAYSVLFDARSRQMEATLNHQKNVRDAHPESDQLCLHCHGLDRALDHPELQSDGVSCESCHGPARAWLSQHYLPGWQGLSKEAKHAVGFIDTRNLVERGKACAACHVGEADKEVNHDLIAAGHPRLTFEYSAYLALEVKHWDNAAEKRQYPDLEVRTWALGQVISAQKELELLSVRAADLKRPWPEFAQYDCFACHHDLKSKSWRTETGYPGRRPGTPDWAVWFRALLPLAVEASGVSDTGQIEQHLQDIHQKMGPSNQRQAVAALARQLARELERPAQLLAAADLERMDRLLDRLLHPTDNRSELTWDRATQQYLALAAAVNARNDRDGAPRDPAFEKRVRTIADLLRFPGGPRPGDQFDSPSNFDPDRVLQAFRNLGSSPSR